MNAVVKALYQKLTGDAALVALLHDSQSVYEKPPEGAQYPYVVITTPDARPQLTLGEGKAFEKEIYTIKGVAGSKADVPKPSIAQAIDERISTLIGVGGQLTITGRTLLTCHRYQSMPPYDETKADTVVFHRGGMYKIWSS